MDVSIIADYGDKLYSFVMACTFDHAGDMQFCVKEPQTIAGITGTIKMDGGFLTFDDQAVAFPLLADEQLTPVTAPWIFMKTLRGGYIRYAGQEGENLRVYIDDSYEEDSLQLDILLDAGQAPLQAEIIWQNRRILSLTIENFTIL
jgi:hypothetical protein